jgi:thiol:disulfide interchange protein
MGTPLQMIWPFLKQILIIDFVIFGVAGLIWFTGVIRITDHFGTLLQILGVIAIVLGALSVTGNSMLAGDLNYQLARTTSQMGSQERVMQEVKDRGQRGSFVVLMAGAGILSIMIGTLMHAIFP